MLQGAVQVAKIIASMAWAGLGVALTVSTVKDMRNENTNTSAATPEAPKQEATPA